MSNNIQNPSSTYAAYSSSSADRTKAVPLNKAGKDKGSSFGDMVSTVADVALMATSAVAPMLPGGALIGMAADGLARVKNGSGLGDAKGDQLNKMWAMQEESQLFNMQYMELQQKVQEENRNFSSMSNILKARHDTAKSAINNMHA